MSKHIMKTNCGACGHSTCQCNAKKFQNDYGTHMVSNTKCGYGSEPVEPAPCPRPGHHGHGQTHDACCVEFICDTPVINPVTGQYQMIQASLLEPVRLWMPREEAQRWFQSGKARECGAGETPECQKGDPGPPGPRGVAGQPGNAGRDGQNGNPGQQGAAGPAGMNGVPGQNGIPGNDGQSAAVFSDYVNGMLIISTINPGEEPKDTKITIPTCADIFAKMCDCFDEVFAPDCPC